MLDIKFIRENPDLIKEAARKKHIDFDVEKLLQIDEEKRKILAEAEDLRAKQNTASEQMPQIKEDSERQKLITEMKAVKEELSAKEVRLKAVVKEWESLMFDVPNVPDPSVPEGNSDLDNREIRKWGEIPDFGFELKSHIELMENLNLVDFERGVKVAGFRGYFLKGDAALLSVALWQLAFEMWAKKGFVPLIAPSLCREINFTGSGWLPQGKEEIYKTQDDLYLAGTAEVPVMGFHQDEILEEKDLPKKYVAFSSCYRREAGSYGKEEKGIFRLHEFMKVEQVILCRADHEESVKWHEEITKNSEEIMQALDIPYRVVLNCGADLGLGQVKKYDIEAWIPSEGRYRETHSSSYFHDFQTRRLDIRYRSSEGKVRFCHSLNNTAIATPRVLIALLENNQQKDGSVKVPEILVKYIGKNIIS
ncbi:MAG: serine--tRNA ligase [Candidatus Tagabacteria bacterium CG_4_8_14_3_um_filter_41_8]|uniref:Serine--tRNA ligase n=1 Tax=Candidatus Tagabacteria bacterium CG_4_8_14_3_um_filter_41_8 TaxID=1975018 RepID=A0A2M8G940_9BACT|nr:MAG: serine--tRNA ligase [Candidatus Tagabacteria bacterium CG_4_8_14_3_um_filter_41_8]